MKYRFATERQNYTDYASGRVFYSAPGHPAFPVRLASEILQRCLAARHASSATGTCVVYDPCCGGAYHLGTLAYLHWEAIEEIVESDIDDQILTVAGRNLSLLTIQGVDRRISEISQMLASYGKSSHAAALESAESLRKRLQKLGAVHQVKTHLFRADALDSQALQKGLGSREVDIVFTDIPYGWHSAWKTSGDARAPTLRPVDRMLDSLLQVLAPGAVIAVATDKRQKVSHEGYRRVEKFQLGKRRITLLEPVTQGR